MKKAEKEMHMYSFPNINYQTQIVMRKGNRSANYAVFLAKDNNLYIRCYHRYFSGRISENNRYVFTESGCCRYGKDDNEKWKIRQNVIEPVFAQFPYYTSYMNADYSILGMEKIKDTCMKYSGLEYFKGNEKIMYLKFWQKHKSAELLLKAGFDVYFKCDEYNWEGTSLSEILGISKGDIKALVKSGKQQNVHLFKDIRKENPDLSAEQILEIIDIFGYRIGDINYICRNTGLNIYQVVKYLKKFNIEIYEYNDYLRQCRELEYDTTIKEINRPKKFNEMHDKLNRIIKIKENAENNQKTAEIHEKKKYLEFQHENLIALLPKSADEIIDEGKTLSHCVGSYAERHANERLTILFLRTIEKPDAPYYTIEVSADGHIVQCRGFKNNIISLGGHKKTQDIIDFEIAYQKYLDGIFKNVRFA